MLYDKICEIVKKAGEIAVGYYGKVEGYLKPDGSWATEADKQVEIFLCDELHRLFDVCIYGEERGWSGREDADYRAIIDPIDGTALYRDHLPLWGISVAIFYRQQPFCGIFYMPLCGYLFTGGGAAGACLNGKQLTLSYQGLSPLSAIGVSSDVHRWNLALFPGKLRAYGVSGFDVCRVASGMLTAALLTKFYYYDIAAGYILLKQIGGELFYLSGNPVPVEEILSMESPSGPVIACHADAFRDVRNCIGGSLLDKPVV